jgi:hypothetical protein
MRVVNLLEHWFALLRKNRQTGNGNHQEEVKSAPIEHQASDYSVLLRRWCHLLVVSGGSGWSRDRQQFELLAG